MSKATLNVQDKLCTDASSNSKLYAQEEPSISQTSLIAIFFIFFLNFALTHSYTYFCGSVQYIE